MDPFARVGSVGRETRLGKQNMALLLLLLMIMCPGQINVHRMVAETSQQSFKSGYGREIENRCVFENTGIS